MSRSRHFLRLAGLTSLAVFAIGIAPVASEEPPARLLDRSKVLVIEKPAQELVKSSSTPAPVASSAAPVKSVLDITKGTVIERPAEKVVKDLSGTPAATAGGFVNPKVEPGKVKWHPTLAAACAAARTSGRPVLLFQMMGKLDDQFC